MMNYNHPILRNVLIGVAIAGVLVGCTQIPTDPRQPTITVSDQSIPAKGIYTVQDVQIKSLGGDDYELAAGANFNYRPDEIIARIWCRATLLAKEKQYDGWYPRVSRYIRYSNGKRVADGIVTLFHGDFPSGVSHASTAQDWCAKANN